jgi:dTDP-glucose 4,6-dehydratase
MSVKLRKILVTGGAGFMGSAFVKAALRKGYRLIVVDKLTYAGDLKRLEGLTGKLKFYKADICDRRKIAGIFAKERPGAIVNFAAETHVDRSIRDPGSFIQTNLIGTKVLLESSLKYAAGKFIQVSTDEVYGESGRTGFSEDSSLRPSSPYSASKAAADLLLHAYRRTYGLPGMIVRPSNNYGPWQYPEKLIPLAVLRILRNERVPVYGNGCQVRSWLYVDDCIEGILRILEKGRAGEVYNLGSNEELRNLDVVTSILQILGASAKRIEFVKDRAGHDLRYRLNSRKISADAGWGPKTKFQDGIRLTVQWCLRNRPWLMSKWKGIATLYRNR